jgi:hypothetical protein
MTQYLVCYTIPEEKSDDTPDMRKLIAIVEGQRAGDYQPIYQKLNEIGDHILTSTYRAEYNGTAIELRDHLLNGLTNDLKNRIELFVTEIVPNSAAFPS